VTLLRWAWYATQSLRVRREVNEQPPTLIDILAAIGPRDDRGGGETPTRGE
jgi:hypothetical protein